MKVGKAIGASILDLTGHNPITRLPNSQFHTLNGIRDWLRIYCANELGETRYTPARFKLRNTASLQAQVGQSNNVDNADSTDEENNVTIRHCTVS